MEISVVGNGGPEKTDPDQHVAGQLFRPEQGGVQDISTKHLDGHQDGHGKPQTGYKVFNAPVSDRTTLFKKPEHVDFI